MNNVLFIDDEEFKFPFDVEELRDKFESLIVLCKLTNNRIEYFEDTLGDDSLIKGLYIFHNNSYSSSYIDVKHDENVVNQFMINISPNLTGSKKMMHYEGLDDLQIKNMIDNLIKVL